ncbi:error-prone DNA polymerase [Aquisalinus luteolus]|uniref:Error-prone DNA polymerase n=1 Tax=Aquisalinus luteolus TaxID=1566827 RepID=A0A8J3ETP9_9PROT|nr:error-prone DNA polymerase [Aquisalinus luteolus]GGH94666.1 error-prone DNA polymerase [Aquisalinus luteolus]
MSYAELGVISNFTFLTGASHAEELIERACELGLPAIAIADTNSFAGSVRAHAAALEAGIQFIVATRIVLAGGEQFIALPQDRAAYGRLCRLLTVGKRRAKKGHCTLHLHDLLEWAQGSVLIALEAGEDSLRQLIERFPDHLYLALSPAYDGNDPARFAERAALADTLSLPLVATGNVIMHRAARRAVADILTCLREKTSIDRLGRRALLNSERRLKSPFEMHRLFKAFPEALANTMRVAQSCRFSLAELKYEYPDEVTDGKPALKKLRELTDEGLHQRYPDGVPLEVQETVEREFSLIAQLDYAPYFLTVHDVVAFARTRGILCQGRGSAANSVICYALGITSVSPEIITMVFERFVSEARNEPPDIDVDFEHERREEVIQHIYDKYGRHRAGICATVIHFRSKAAIREVGKAMGLSADALMAISSQIWGWSDAAPAEDRLRAAGLNPHDRRLRLTLSLIREIIGFPRHLSQHVGGFVITRDRLDELVPVENAAMDDRTMIEWDKDDIDVLGLLKVDVLALGMLTCIRKAFDLLEDWRGVRYSLASLPQEDPAVYAQISQGDTTGLFQVESRAQMSFLPRMRPNCFYDLIIEVAIIRPGPIQGDMVHPYLRRRRGEEEIVYPSPELEEVLKRTLGVPLFQEQAMRIAVVVAGFTAGEADALRRALGAFRKIGNVSDFQDRFIAGAISRGYEPEFAEKCFKQLEGFSGYGFPESHAASFALLVYASAWLRHHHPEVYCAAILNSQPMGFYAPAQLVADAQRHGVEVRPVDINASSWDCALEPDGKGGLAVRLGFRQIKGFKEDDALWLVAARGNGYRDVAALWRRAGLLHPAIEKLAMADAFASIGMNRREALWHAKAVDTGTPMPLLGDPPDEDRQASGLPLMSLAEEVFEDFVSVRLSLKDHPVRLVRDKAGGNLTHARNLRDVPQNSRATILGAVITRQRPATASGVIFVTLEDETGSANIIVWPKTFERYRREVMQGRLLRITGKVQKEGLVVHVIADRIEDRSDLFDNLGQSGQSHIDMTWSSADEAKRQIPDSRQSSRHQEKPDPAPATHPRIQARRLFASRDFK